MPLVALQNPSGVLLKRQHQPRRTSRTATGPSVPKFPAIYWSRSRRILRIGRFRRQSLSSHSLPSGSWGPFRLPRGFTPALGTRHLCVSTSSTTTSWRTGCGLPDRSPGWSPTALGSQRPRPHPRQCTLPSLRVLLLPTLLCRRVHQYRSCHVPLRVVQFSRPPPQPALPHLRVLHPACRVPRVLHLGVHTLPSTLT